MKIALVCPASLPATQFGGPLTLFVELARELGKLDNDVTIYTTDLDFANKSNTFNKNLPRLEKYDYFKINRTHAWFSVYTFFVNFGMFFQLKKDKSDIIQIIGVRSFQSLIAALISKIYHIPLIVEDQSGLATQPEEKKGSTIKRILYKIQTPMIKFIINQGEKIVVPNEYEKNVFLKFCEPSKIVVIPNGISLELLQSKVFNFKEKYGIQDRFILFVGRFAKVKGIDTLLLAFSLIKDHLDVQNVSLVVMGADYGFESEMMDMIKSLGLKNKVIVISKPPREDVISAYGASEFLALPSRWELSPMTPLEGFAFKKAVISTNVHGIPYTIRDKERGILIDPENYQELSESMLELLQNKEKRDRYGLAGYKFITEIANSKNMATKTLKLYHDLIK
jgi:glycosyltransferase involved in cell wall biosynthesis